MRIRSLVVNGFRGFATEQSFDFDADAIIITAPNGQGKTSLFDAILWVLVGSVPRIGNDSYLVSKYSESGQASVSINISSAESDIKLTRLFDGTSQSVNLEYNGEPVRSSNVQDKVLELLWPSALSAPKPLEAFTSAITRTVYLQQDLVRDFVQDADDQTRYNAISEIIGTGRITELQVQLENAKAAWTKASNERYAETADVRARVESIEEQLRVLQAEGKQLPELAGLWNEWWSEARDGLHLVDADMPVGSVRAPSALDKALKSIANMRLAIGRKLDIASQFAQFYGTRPTEPSRSELQATADERKALAERVNGLQGEVTALRSKKTEFERMQAEQAKAASEMVELAHLALRHLDEHCPVCQQTYDREQTRIRLERVLQQGGMPLSTAVPDFGIDQRLAELQALQTRELELTSKERSLRASFEQMKSWNDELRRRMSLIGVQKEADIEPTSEQLARQESALGRLQSSGESLAAKLTAASEVQRSADLGTELDTLKAQVAAADSEYQSRQRTGDVALEIIEALRSASYDLVARQLTEIEPLLQRIYETADPHPAFKTVRLISRVFNKRGRLATQINDPEVEDASTSSPSSILSSSQLNVLAVSIFLALNLAVRELPVGCAILDDPLQSLDDLNLLGLVDVFRQVKERRQLFISTHDAQFGGLLRRKLRAVREGQRTRAIEISNWSRLGPDVIQYEVPHEVWSETPRVIAK